MKVYIKYTSNIVNLDDVYKLLSDYFSTNNKNFDFSFINGEFVLEFDKNFIAKIGTSYFFNADINNINRYLLYDIDCFKPRGYKFYNINQRTISIISDR